MEGSRLALRLVNLEKTTQTKDAPPFFCFAFLHFRRAFTAFWMSDQWHLQDHHPRDCVEKKELYTDPSTHTETPTSRAQTEDKRQGADPKENVEFAHDRLAAHFKLPLVSPYPPGLTFQIAVDQAC